MTHTTQNEELLENIVYYLLQVREVELEAELESCKLFPSIHGKRIASIENELEVVKEYSKDLLNKNI